MVPVALTVFLLGVFTDKGYLSIASAEESAKTDEIKVRRHEKECVARVIFVKFVPDLLGEK